MLTHSWKIKMDTKQDNLLPAFVISHTRSTEIIIRRVVQWMLLDPVNAIPNPGIL